MLPRPPPLPGRQCAARWIHWRPDKGFFVVARRSEFCTVPGSFPSELDAAIAASQAWDVSLDEFWKDKIVYVPAHQRQMMAARLLVDAEAARGRARKLLLARSTSLLAGSRFLPSNAVNFPSDAKAQETAQNTRPKVSAASQPEAKAPSRKSSRKPKDQRPKVSAPKVPARKRKQPRPATAAGARPKSSKRGGKGKNAYQKTSLRSRRTRRPQPGGPAKSSSLGPAKSSSRRDRILVDQLLKVRADPAIRLFDLTCSTLLAQT